MSQVDVKRVGYDEVVLTPQVTTVHMFDRRRLIRRGLLSVWEAFVRTGVRVAQVASKKAKQQLPNFKSKKANGVKRKPAKQSAVFKSDSWYANAALLMSAQKASAQ